MEGVHVIFITCSRGCSSDCRCLRPIWIASHSKLFMFMRLWQRLFCLAWIIWKTSSKQCCFKSIYSILFVRVLQCKVLAHDCLKSASYGTQRSTRGICHELVWAALIVFDCDATNTKRTFAKRKQLIFSRLFILPFAASCPKDSHAPHHSTLH